MSAWGTILEELPDDALDKLERLMEAAPDQRTAQAEIVRVLTEAAPSAVVLDRWLTRLGADQ